ncbi:MAG: hypothetical protein ACE149_18455 [Armatimonadota bacterium]
MKQVVRYGSDGKTAAASTVTLPTIYNGQTSEPTRVWWKNASSAGEVLQGCRVVRESNGGSDGYDMLQLASDVPISPPAAPNAAAVAGAGLEIGLYRYAVTFVNAQGETTPGADATATTTNGNQQVSLTSIPIGPSGTTARRLYRTAVGGSVKKLVAEIADNGTTTYTDSTPDASLGEDAPVLNTSGSPGTWQTAALLVGDMAVGDYLGVWARFVAPAGASQLGNPRQAYLRFEETG